jgi:hypothetical protein
VAAISTHFEKRLYSAVDAADKESCRPDFGVALYPGHMFENTSQAFELNPFVPVTASGSAYVLAAERGRPDLRCKELAGLLCGAEFARQILRH